MGNAMNKFMNVCKLEQKELKKYLEKYLSNNGYKDVFNGDGFLYAPGTIPVLVTAHMDTVHKEKCTNILVQMNDKKQTVLSSKQGIGGDDRCGIYAIMEIIKTLKPYVLFCEDEEIGGVGSEKFCNSIHVDELSKLKYLIELDRAHDTDAVFYDCDNAKFTEFIETNTGYKEAYGSFSDISVLSPACKVASVNLSCGYYKPHTTSEYVVWEELLRTIDEVKGLLSMDMNEVDNFEYIECKHSWGYYGNYGRYYDYDYDYSSGNYKSYGVSNSSSYTEQDVYASYEEGYNQAIEDYDLDANSYSVNYEEGSEAKESKSVGANVYEALGRFFIENPTLCYNDIIDVYN